MDPCPDWNSKLRPQCPSCPRLRATPRLLHPSQYVFSLHLCHPCACSSGPCDKLWFLAISVFTHYHLVLRFNENLVVNFWYPWRHNSTTRRWVVNLTLRSLSSVSITFCIRPTAIRPMTVKNNIPTPQQGIAFYRRNFINSTRTRGILNRLGTSPPSLTENKNADKRFEAAFLLGAIIPWSTPFISSSCHCC